MKNLYLCIALMLYVVAYAQLHNANWYFGDHAGMSFLTATPTELTDMPLSNSFYPAGSNTAFEGMASVSDQSGNLLFYTNGVEVFTHNHAQMDNGFDLKGHLSSTQNVIIVPVPGNSDRFYIFTIDGQTGNGEGLHYSLVDMSLAGGLGKVILKNVALKDHNGIPVDSSYNHLTHPKSEKITSAFCGDGVNYWVITQVKNFIYSYKVTANMIGNSLLPNTVYSMPTEDTSVMGSFIKISPDGKTLATAFKSASSSTIAYKTGEFNSITGAVTNVTNNILQAATDNRWEMEFSPDSKILYFVSRMTGSYKLNKHNLATGQTQLIAQYPAFGGIRLGINGKMYIKTDTHKISVLHNPNNFTNPGYSFAEITLTRSVNQGFPQFVNWYPEVCNSLVLNSETHTAPFIYNNKSDITAQGNYVITAGADIEMSAQNFIHLKGDTHITNSANYWGHQVACNTSTARLLYAEKGADDEAFVNGLDDQFLTYPNPASNKVNLRLNDDYFYIITLLSIDGKVILSKKADKSTNEYLLDINTIPSGMYILNATTSSGNYLTKKLVVKN
ncbi:T9SS type A sorting domain-containing protein [Flavobacterium zepuense]|uniref:T9SS type A sorting domain-containing protein n=1 Tax=Flavobacterium zepuense TaxID=2593302 RepID=A0A552V9W7_9FLAO|nr:T9SS type A sorting domain-containing protein [Flavobacterium zepuense]TRW27265.1 T9SS type A sorting domain-containing protein [Flavobacterium zepuense]